MHFSKVVLKEVLRVKESDLPQMQMPQNLYIRNKFFIPEAKNIETRSNEY